MQSEKRYSSTLKRAVFLYACLSIGASHWPGFPAYRSQIQLNYSQMKIGNIRFNAPYTLELMLLHQCQTTTDATKLPLVLKLGMTGQSSRRNGFELYVCRSCHTPFVFWSGTHAGLEPQTVHSEGNVI